MESFSVGSALTHFLNTKGPGRFLTKYILTYTAILVGFSLIYGVFYYLLLGQPISAIMEGGSPDAMSGYMLRFALFSLISLPLSAVYLSIVEGAALRRYVRFEPFSIRFGADEFRLIGVYALYFGLIIAVYIAMILIVLGIGLIGSLFFGADSAIRWLGAFIPIIIFLAYLSIFVFIIWGLLRLSPASSLTIRDKRITFLSAAHLSRGYVWKLFGAYALLVIVMYAVLAVVMGVMFAIGAPFLLGAPDIAANDPVAPLGAETGTTMMLISSLSTVVLSPLYAAIHVCGLGIPAKLAVTDPDWPGAIEQAGVFD